MSKETWDWLNEFGKRKNLCCKKEEPDWSMIDKFISIGYDLSTQQGRRDNKYKDISDEQLRQKIIALGVPWRSQDGR